MYRAVHRRWKFKKLTSDDTHGEQAFKQWKARTVTSSLGGLAARSPGQVTAAETELLTVQAGKVDGMAM